jgi:uncharacterized protein YjbI with pentapeptide repeats
MSLSPSETNLRGIDLRGTRLESASLKDSPISGTYFPEALTAEELTLPVTQGIRLRYRTEPA